MDNQKIPFTNIGKFAAGIIVLVCGALMTAEAVTTTVTGDQLFFSGINRGFEFMIGFIVIILGASLIDDNRKNSFRT
jgi:Na+/H+ antiporter NhaC